MEGVVEPNSRFYLFRGGRHDQTSPYDYSLLQLNTNDRALGIHVNLEYHSIKSPRPQPLTSSNGVYIRVMTGREQRMFVSDQAGKLQKYAVERVHSGDFETRKAQYEQDGIPLPDDTVVFPLEINEQETALLLQVMNGMSEHMTMGDTPQDPALSPPSR